MTNTLVRRRSRTRGDVFDHLFATGVDQQTDEQAAIVKPEGRVHFAGEHCSLYHAWIQGALERRTRAAKEVHEAGAAEAMV